MKSLIKIEIKRIFGIKYFVIILVIISIFSIISSMESYSNYNVYDQYGNIIISSKDNLKESKLEKHHTFLDEKLIKSVVDQEDTSKFSYNLKISTLIASNYSKKIVDLTEQDIKNYYNQRMLNVAANTRASDEVWLTMSKQFKPLNTPLEIGYAEGWLNLNTDMIDFATLIIYIIPFLMLFVFGETPKVNMKQLYSSTKHGKGYYIKAKLITAFGLGTGIYMVGIGIFSLFKLGFLGFQGGNLPIQNNMRYLFCPYNLTYIQQYFINVVVGLLALLLLISFTLIITLLVKQILPSATVLLLFLLIMPMFPNNNKMLNYCFKNFLPYYMTNFEELYVHSYVYTVGGVAIPALVMISVVALFICALSIFIIVAITKKDRID